MTTTQSSVSASYSALERRMTREALKHPPAPSLRESAPTSDYCTIQRGLEERQDVRDAQIEKLTGQVEQLEKTVKWMLDQGWRAKPEAA
jgi:hypothetical protein